MQTIYFGAPGTGKSHTIDEKIVAGIPEEYLFRVTFYPEYSYNDFIGQLLPVVIPPMVAGGTPTITYSFVKGVFTRALEKAYDDTSKAVYLIIEEMSRGDCAAIFGDIFQLLDRVKSGVDKGYSRYFITNELIAKDIVALKGDKVKLPPNFHILGTVNTSDQNVFVMDTAFKRRFEWEYVSPDPVALPAGGYANDVSIDLVVGSTTKSVMWTDLYQRLNTFIADEKYLGLGEDKQIGPFFIEFAVSGSPADHKKQIKNKLLHYLWSDINKASYKSNLSLFRKDIGTFKVLYDEFEANKQIFSDDFLALI